MSKRGGFPGMGGGFGGMNLNQLMKEAKKMQSDMEKSQEELAEKEFEASAGGEAVKVKVSGRKEIKELKIKPEVLDPEDVEMLEDLITTCVNNALKQVDDAQAASLGTGRQYEAARIAVTRYMQRQGQIFWIRIFPGQTNYSKTCRCAYG